MQFKTPAAFSVVVGVCVAVAAWACAPAFGQSYPDRPIKYIVPWTAGGSADAAGRILAQQLGERLHQTIVVDNRPGANGRLGADLAAKAPADGYTLVLAGAETHAINPALYSTLPYNPVRDFAMVAPYAINPFAVVARANINAANMRELVAAAKAAPGKLTAASWGVGSTSHLALEVIKSQAGIDVLHVPFQGEAPAVSALMGGHVDLMVLPAIRAEILRKEGKVKVLGVTTKERVSFIADVPTLNEQGYNVNVVNWIGVGVPAKTSPEIVQRLSVEIVALLQKPSFGEALLQLGLFPHPAMTPSQFQKFMEDEVQRWGGLIKSAKVPTE
ncbi:Bug family tripartite tricarboxylate transporter substrate binding protein [Hydrogenophaga sp. BPS33]|uniref:Bug family tripartite tricarboxylate transporter substrate binding protein n=1 Tax=Hydrogenophaga sp. BPS33 TaxID=2651974 RepID=UPI00135975C6|nr:tripartite tricarboxylate transporter substrate binding protein [Hydrogenophaga sp. BPS33]